jgi:GMP synthase (glutamine-hydrolysing)
MRIILIIKVGSTLPAILAGRGDFEDWIAAGLGVDRKQVHVTALTNGDKLPDYKLISGVVITGSHFMVTEHRDWSEYAAKWLPGAVERRIPILGICYGHQLLAYSLGGKVADNPKGLEFGTIEVNLHDMALADPLFHGIDNPLRVHACHTQSVLDLPPHAEALASSEMDRHQAFIVGECAWGVQFHPEFDAAIMSEYIDHYRQTLSEEGVDPDKALSNVADTDYGPKLLARFYQLIKEHERDEVR